MSTRDELETAISRALATRDKANAERAKAGVNWRRSSDDPSITFDKVRLSWVQADEEWNKANAAIEKLTAELAELKLTEEARHSRAALEAAVARARSERDKADAALAAVAKARAEQDNQSAVAAARPERRGNDERRKPGADRRTAAGDRRGADSKPSAPAVSSVSWNEAVSNYNKADAEWNKARAALAELSRPARR